MNIKEILTDYLIKNGYDGLFNVTDEPCGCDINDLMNCDEYCGNCESGYKFISQCVCENVSYYICDSKDVYECSICNKKMKRININENIISK